MNSLRRHSDERLSRDLRVTKAQRRMVNHLLRDGYDMAKAATPAEDFAVSVHTADLSENLSHANERYFGKEQASDDMNALFSRIALNATIEIDKAEQGYVISLLRELPTDRSKPVRI